MADIELVIKIPEKLAYEGFERPFTEDEKHILIRAIGNGTPLPKGHGRLGDLNRLEECVIDKVTMPYVPINAILNAPTIIEADKESEE